MRVLVNKKIVYLALILGFVGLSQVRASETLDRILVVVNDQIITESDLDRVLQPILSRMKATVDEDTFKRQSNEARSAFLKQLIDDRLIISEAHATDTTVDETEVDEMMDDMRSKFPSDDVFENVLQQQGLTRKKLRERFSDDIIKRRIIDFKVRARVAVSPGEIKDFYDEHKDEFLSPPEVRVRQILIRAGDTRSDEDAKEVASSLYDRLAAGEDMTALATQYSEGSENDVGGDMGWIKEGQYMQNLDKAIFALQLDEISAPIQTRLGYHIFRVEQQKERVVLSLSEIRNRIEGMLYKEKTAELLKSWLKELREDAYISYRG